MKKITLFILTIFTVATLFAAARPSLDGRAVVADSGTMPRGLFARTVGYLPGDSVTVTNPATGSTIDVLILGAIDPSEGVAILLSPEAADGLRIKPDSNVQVKLTKRSGSLDENANGTAVLSEGEIESEIPARIEEIPAKNERPLIASSSTAEPARFKEVPADEEDESYEEIPVVAENALAEKKASEPAGEEVPAEEEYEEIPVVAEKTPVAPAPVEEERLVAKPANERPLLSKVEPVTEEPYEEEEVQPDTVYEILPALPANERTYGKQKVVVIEEKEENSPEDSIVENTLVEEVPVKIANADANEDVSEEKVAAEIALSPAEGNTAEEPVTEEVPALEENVLAAADDEEFVDEEEPAGVEEEPVVVMNEEPSDSDAYQPIVLVPADMNPPAPAEENAFVAEKNVPELTVPTPLEEKTEIATEEAPKIIVSNSWTNYVVPSVKNLRSGSYYVQVASLGNTENIKNFVDKYSVKYPVVLVQNSSKNAYQVMVGPLNIDEYGAVGEKFKDYGFKDSFVRKIK